MDILDERCSRCGSCVPECPRQAIAQDPDGQYCIDGALCDDCRDLFEVQCVRVCPADAIVRRLADGQIEESTVERTLRFRAYNLAYFIAALSPRGFRGFENPAWGKLREFIANAYLHPEQQIVFSTPFDDHCHGCPRRRDAAHVAGNAEKDQKAMARLGVRPGQVMGLWDALRLAEERFDAAFLTEVGLDGYAIEYYFLGRPEHTLPGR